MQSACIFETKYRKNDTSIQHWVCFQYSLSAFSASVLPSAPLAAFSVSVLIQHNEKGRY